MGVLKVWDGTDWRKINCCRTSSPYPDEVIADSPALYWRLNDDAYLDTSGNGHTGYAPGGVATFTPAAGLLTGGCDGAGDFASQLIVQHDYAAWMDATSFTAEAVMQTTAASGYRTIMQRDDMGAGPREWSLLLRSDGKLEGRLWGTSSTTLVGSTVLNDGDVHHVAMTYEGSTLKLYADGTLDASSSHGTTLGTASADLRVGGNVTFASPAVDQLWADVLDEAAFYTTALSGSRIAAHAAAVAVADPVAGLLRLWTGTGWVREACDDDGFRDNFNRADGALGSPWTFPHGHTFSIVSGKAVLTSTSGASGEPIAITTVPGLGYEVDLHFDLEDMAHPGGSLIFNYLSPGNFHMWNIAAGTSALYKFTSHSPAGVYAPAASGVGTYRVVTDDAGNVDFYAAGVLVGSATTTWHTDGYGVGFQSSTVNHNTADNFTAEPVARPLKIEDPANPGTWITVACFVPV